MNLPRLDFEKLARIISTLLATTAVFYYLVVFLPSVEKNRLNRIEINRKLQEDCLRDASTKLQTVLQGVDSSTTNQAWVDRYISVYQDQKDDCYKRFSTDL